MQLAKKDKEYSIFHFVTSLLFSFLQNKISGSPSKGKGMGPTGFCYCPNCGYQEPHQRGIPCTSKKCRKCGSTMNRKG